MPNVAEFLIERLATYGVRHIFNVPGDYSLAFCKQVEKGPLKLVGTTDEAAAGFAADAYARVNGMGAVCVTYCVGGFKALNAVAGAFAEKSPVVVISGAPGLKERSGDVLLHHMVRNFECQHSVFQNVTCAQAVLNDTSRAAYEIDRVLEAAQTYKQPVYIELPRDIIGRAVSYDPYTVGTPRNPTSDPVNLQEVLREVVTWINEAKNPVIWAGVEIARHGLGERLMKFVEQTGIPIATDIIGKSVVNERHPLCMGVYSESTSGDAVREYFAKSDCVVMLGVMMTDMNLGFLPLRPQRRQIVFATSQTMQVRNHTYQNVQFPDFVKGLLDSKVNRRESVSVPSPSVEPYKAEPGRAITPVRLFEKINNMLTPDMAIVADVGDSLFGAMDVTVHKPNHFLATAFYTTMGFAVPASLGVQMANPKVRPIVIVGDGAFQMTGAEFSSLVKYGLNPIVFVLNNGGYGTERLMLDGDFNDIQGWNYEKIPALVGGGIGFRVNTEDDLDAACSQALVSREPAIINVCIGKDDYTPPLRRMFTKLAKKV